MADIMRGINADRMRPNIIADHGRHLIGQHTLSRRTTYAIKADNIRYQGGQHTLATHITEYKRHHERLQGRLMVLYLTYMKRLQGRLMDGIGVYGIGYIFGYNTL